MHLHREFPNGSDDSNEAVGREGEYKRKARTGGEKRLGNVSAAVLPSEARPSADACFVIVRRHAVQEKGTIDLTSIVVNIGSPPNSPVFHTHIQH